MTDFAGASLKLRADGEDRILGTMGRIDKKATDTFDGIDRLSKSTIDNAAARFDQLYGKQSQAARRTQAVVEDTAKKVEAATGGMSHSAALGLGELARGFGRVAESGNLSAFAVREFTGSAFRLGNALGSAGVGAGVGLAAIAIGGLIQYFESAKKKADALADGYQKDLEKIAHASSLLTASQAEQEAFSGDPFAQLTGKHRDETDAAFLARSKGLQGLSDEAKRLNVEIDKVSKQEVFSGGTGGGGRNIALEHLEGQLKDINEQVGILGQRWSLADSTRRRLNATEEEAAKIQLQKKQDKIDERSVAEYSNEALAAIVRRIEATHQLVPALISEHDPLVALRDQQELLRHELDGGSLSAAQRIQKMAELARVTKELTQATQGYITIRSAGVGRRLESGSEIENGYSEDLQTVPGFSSQIPIKVKAADLSAANDYDKQQVDAIRKSGEKMQREADTIGQRIGQVLTSSLTSALQAGSVGKGFKAFTDSVLKGLGDMFAAIAEKAIIMSSLMMRFTTWLAANPWLAAAAAVAMLAFAKSLGGSGSGSGGGGYSGSSSASYGNVVDRGYINPGAPSGPVTNPSSIQAKPSVTNVNYIIGPADPVAQRMFDELSRRSSNRGSLA